MKKFLSFMLTLLTVLTLGVGIHANAASSGLFTHTFQSGDLKAGTNNLSGQSFTLETDGGYFGFDNTKGVQIGSSKKPASSIVLTTNFTEKVTSIKISTSGASSIDAVLDVTLAGNKVGNTITLTSTNEEYTFTPATATAGEIKFSYTNHIDKAKKAIYINSIKIEYEKTIYSVIFDSNGEDFAADVQVKLDKPFGENLVFNLPTASQLNVSGAKYLLGWTDGTNNYCPGEELTAPLDVDTTYKAIYRENMRIMSVSEANAYVDANLPGNFQTSKEYFYLYGTVENAETNSFTFKDSTESISAYTKKHGLKNGETYLISARLQHYGDGTDKPFVNQLSSVKIVEFTNEFETVQTKSRLVATLDTESQTLNNIELALGGHLTKAFYEANSTNKFGVIALSVKNIDAVLSLDTLDKTGLDDLIAKNYALELTPVLSGENYNFAWSINNIPADKYNFEFVTVMYMLDAEGNVTLANEKMTSIEATAKQYIDNLAQYNFSEDLVAAIKKVAKVA